MRGLIPNAFTMGNLICGCLAIFSVFETKSFTNAALLIGLGALFDVFDGLLARVLKVAGPLGKQLDSLADAVSFGVAPTVMVTVLLFFIEGGNWPEWMLYSPLILLVASIYRLGKFNIDTRQTDKFMGLPTPANALLWISICMLYEHGFFVDFPIPGWAIVLLCGLMGLWMISDIPLIALKFKSLEWKPNQSRYLLILSAIIIPICSKIAFDTVFVAVPIILLLYLLISLWDRRKTRSHEISS